MLLPLFRDVVWLSLLRAAARVSPSRSKALTPTDRQRRWEERAERKGGGGRYNNQISHFHNSTFLNKLSRLSHQTILPRPVYLSLFVFWSVVAHSWENVLFLPGRGNRAVCFVRTGVKRVYIHHTGLSLLLKSKNQRPTRWQQGALQQRQMEKFWCKHTLLILASDVTLVQKIALEISEEDMKVDI